MYLTILKWLGVIALALALIGGPTVYVQRKIDAAAKAGFEAGYGKRVDEDNIQSTAQARKNFTISEKEFAEAQQRAKDFDTTQRKVVSLESKLAQAIQKANIPPICNIDVESSRLLRNAANGTFTTDTETSNLPSGPSDQMSGSVGVS